MRERLCMDQGWSFHEGDIQDNVVHGYMYTYMQTKTERGRGPASMDYDASDWKNVNLPHDYVVRGVPDPKENHVHGSLKRDNAWYRKIFGLKKEDADKRIVLSFEGIGTVSKIWVNGCFMKYNDSAYTEIEVDITDVARFGDDLNVVSVYIDNEEFEGWWYEGAGIYRHVYLDITEKVSVGMDGVYVNPARISKENWLVSITTDIRNDLDKDAEALLTSKVVGATGETLAEVTEKYSIAARDTRSTEQVVEIKNPPIWSLEEPNLCKVKTTIVINDQIWDEYETMFGFRTIRFDPEEGFFLNEKPVKIKGMCIHEDHGGLGSGLPDRVKEYRVKCLKKMGCNGYRFSHNPHSRETLDICDRLGMLVMDENRWFESSEDGKRRVQAMVKRDRNHPSVVIWSMGNEEFLQSGATGRKIMASLKSSVKKLDKTRPVLMAMHTGLLSEAGSAEICDMIGMNYNIDLCEEVHKRYPDKPIIFSEVSNASEEDVLGNRQAGIDTWRIVDTHSYMSGMFAWTGMDYRGEHAYPELFAPCGAMDQNGYPKNCFYLYQAYWAGKPMVYIQPHWNWPGKEGQKIQVRIFTTGDYVKLYLNGRLIDESAVDLYEMANFQVEYEPGILKAVVEKNGRFEAETERKTAGNAAKLSLTLENEQVTSSVGDVAILTVKALDKEGREVPTADNLFNVNVKQGGQLLVTGNGDICDQSDRTLPECRLYDGHGQIIVSSSKAEEDIIVQVTSDTLESAEITIPKIVGERKNKIAAEKSRYLNRWEVSEWMKDKPEEVNGIFECPSKYSEVEIGHGTNMHDLSKNSGYFVYHTKARTPEHEGYKDTSIQFELLEGQSWIYAEIPGTDKKFTGHKESEDPEAYKMDLGMLEGDLEMEIWVLLHVWMPFCGITKPVRWETEGDRCNEK